VRAGEPAEARKSLFGDGGRFIFGIVEDVVMGIRFHVLLLDSIDDVVGDASDRA